MSCAADEWLKPDYSGFLEIKNGRLNKRLKDGLETADVIRVFKFDRHLNG